MKPCNGSSHSVIAIWIESTQLQGDACTLMAPRNQRSGFLQALDC